MLCCVQAKATPDNTQKMLNVAQEVTEMWLEMMEDPDSQSGITEEEHATLCQLEHVLLNYVRRDQDNKVAARVPPSAIPRPAHNDSSWQSVACWSDK